MILVWIVTISFENIMENWDIILVVNVFFILTKHFWSVLSAIPLW